MLHCGGEFLSSEGLAASSAISPFGVAYNQGNLCVFCSNFLSATNQDLNSIVDTTTASIIGLPGFRRV
jgi:hypothetical protein